MARINNSTVGITSPPFRHTPDSKPTSYVANWFSLRTNCNSIKSRVKGYLRLLSLLRLFFLLSTIQYQTYADSLLIY